RYCRLAKLRLAAPNRATNAAELAAWLVRLQDLNRQKAGEHHFEPVRAQAEERADASPAAGNSADALNIGTSAFVDADGIPTYWQASPGSSGPRLQLAAVEQEKSRQAFALTGLLVLLCLIAWFMSYLRRAVAVLRAFWPEQLIVLACLAWLFIEPNIGFALLVLVWVVGR